MRVLHVSAGLPEEAQGPDAVGCLNSAIALSELGVETAIFAGANDLPAGSHELGPSIGAVPVMRAATVRNGARDWWNEGVRGPFGEYLERFRPAVVHVHSIDGLGLQVVDAARAWGAQIVVSMHDLWWICERRNGIDGAGRCCIPAVTPGSCACRAGSVELAARNAVLRTALRAHDLVLAGSDAIALRLRASGLRSRVVVKPIGPEIRSGWSALAAALRLEYEDLLGTVCARPAPGTGNRLRKVLLVAGAGGPPLHYRVHQKVEQLRLAGVGSAVYGYADPRLPVALEDADAVIVYRAPATKELLGLIDAAHGRGLPTFYDVDDLVFDPEAIAELPIHGKRPPKEKRMWVDNARRYGAALQACGRGIASTPELAQHMRRLGVPADVHPNGVDTTLAVLSEGARRERQGPHDELTIAYCSGTDTHDADLAMVGDVLSEFLGAHPSARLILAGPLEIPPVLRSRSSRVELRGVVGRQRFVRWFADFDLNLAPLVEHTFNECKSSIKWSEAALVEVPTLASATEPFRESIDHEVTGLLASRPEEFAEGLRWADEDIPRLRQMGRAARDAAYLTGSPWRLGSNLIGILTSKDVSGEGVGSLPRAEEWPSESVVATLEPAGLVGGDFPAGVPMRPGQRLGAGPVTFELPDGTATGPLRRVDVHVATWGGSAAGPVSLAIRTGSEILAEATAPADSIQDNGWAAFEFSPGVVTPAGARAEMRSTGGRNVTPYLMPYGSRIAAGRRRWGMVAAKTYYGVLEPPAFGREMLSPAWGGRIQVRAGRAIFRLTKGLAVGRRILRNPRSLAAELGRVTVPHHRRGRT